MQDKTRANAAGALGNLVRNSSALCGELIRAGALRALLDTALSPERPPSGAAAARGGGGGADAGGSPVKIALFSLGNMCAHRECRESLVALGVHVSGPSVTGREGAKFTRAGGNAGRQGPGGQGLLGNDCGYSCGLVDSEGMVQLCEPCRAVSTDEALFQQAR